MSVPLLTGGPLTGLRLHQIGYVVQDLDAAIERYRKAWGIGSWTIRRHDETTTPHTTYDGVPGSFSMRLALTPVDPVIELIEPLTGPSAYDGWLERHGESIHHFGFVVPSLDEMIERMEAAGYPLVQSGRGYGLDGDGAYGYFDTTADLLVYTELIEPPARRSDPEEVR
jgi:methylmalonyl-CoA/ethylmalonyl-CoA epimerase